MMRGVWSVDTIAWVIFAALLPALFIVIAEQGGEGGIRLVISLAVVGFWQVVFAATRAITPCPAGALIAVAVAVLAPGEFALWQLVLGVSFGTVIGELIFGGWGRNVINAAVVTLAFLLFSFPETRHDPASVWVGLASAPAAMLLLATGILSWRVLIGAAVGLGVVTLAIGSFDQLLVQGGLAFGLVFLVGDPVASASTNPGRLLYGALSGVLAGVFGWAAYGIGSPQTIVFAALLASVFAPLIDYGVIETRLRIRALRHG